MSDRPDQILMTQLREIICQNFGDRIHEYTYPPPVFMMMKGELLAIDMEQGMLKARFPVSENYLNPYGAMQGGMIAAAVDNTLGPLSVAVAPPNVTRTLEMKYSQPVTPDMGYIVVQARLVERKDRWLFFEARVSSSDGRKLATCKAAHYLIDSQTD